MPIYNNVDAQKFEAILAKVEKEISEKKHRQALSCKKLIDAAQDAGLTVIEQVAAYKIFGSNHDKRIYVTKNGKRIDVVGFKVNHPKVYFMKNKKTIQGSVLCRVKARTDECDISDVFNLIISEL